MWSSLITLPSSSPDWTSTGIASTIQHYVTIQDLSTPGVPLTACHMYITAVQQQNITTFPLFSPDLQDHPLTWQCCRRIINVDNSLAVAVLTTEPFYLHWRLPTPTRAAGLGWHHGNQTGHRCPTCSRRSSHNRLRLTNDRYRGDLDRNTTSNRHRSAGHDRCPGSNVFT